MSIEKLENLANKQKQVLQNFPIFNWIYMYIDY